MLIRTEEVLRSRINTVFRDANEYEFLNNTFYHVGKYKVTCVMYDLVNMKYSFGHKESFVLLIDLRGWR